MEWNGAVVQWWCAPIWARNWGSQGEILSYDGWTSQGLAGLHHQVLGTALALVLVPGLILVSVLALVLAPDPSA